MEKVFIDAHQGLSDHLICNGIYREYAKNYSECILPVKISIFKTVNFMLSDVPNIKVVAILEKATGKLINSLRNLYAIRNYKILKLGYKVGILQMMELCDLTKVSTPKLGWILLKGGIPFIIQGI